MLDLINGGTSSINASFLGGILMSDIEITKKFKRAIDKEDYMEELKVLESENSSIENSEDILLHIYR